MEPVFTVEHGQEPSVAVPRGPHHGPGQMDGGQGRRGWRVGVLLLIGVTVGFGFAYGVYHARHSRRDLAFVIVTYYLSVVLACCLAKLKQLRRDPAATAAERRRVRMGVWCISVALGTTVTSRVADVVPGLALKLVVWGVSVVLHGLVLYFLFLRKGVERCDAEGLGCGPADAVRGGLSPEEKV